MTTSTPRTDAIWFKRKWTHQADVMHSLHALAGYLEGEVALATDALEKCNKWIEEAKPLLERGGENERALEKLLNRYVELVNSGDCGFWNPEAEPEVIEARRVLKK